MEVYACRALILAHSFPLTTCSSFYILLGFSWSVFNQQKLVRGKGSQIFWIRVPCEGSSDVQLVACMGEWTQIFGFVVGGSRILQCNDAFFFSCLLLLCFIK